MSERENAAEGVYRPPVTKIFISAFTYPSMVKNMEMERKLLADALECGHADISFIMEALDLAEKLDADLHDIIQWMEEADISKDCNGYILSTLSFIRDAIAHGLDNIGAPNVAHYVRTRDIFLNYLDSYINVQPLDTAIRMDDIRQKATLDSLVKDTVAWYMGAEGPYGQAAKGIPAIQRD